jgi:hypothetical protein
MNYRKCDLCGVDEAMEDGLLCPSCREAIVRLLTIGGSEQSANNEISDTAIATMNYPEIRQKTRKAGS